MKTEPTFEKIETSINPFVNWNETKEIEGIVSNVREIDGEFGPQEICDVGKFSVNITTALRSLPRYEGEYIKIVYLGMCESKKGRSFKAFDIFRRK